MCIRDRWGETRKAKSEYLSQLHTDYHNEVGCKYGLQRGIPYNELSEEEKLSLIHISINTVALQTGLPPSSIEKDWWVTQVLKALHTLPYAEHIAFKGEMCIRDRYIVL